LENWPIPPPSFKQIISKKHLITRARARGLDKLLLKKGIIKKYVNKL